jgi:hypothetical protein
LFCFCLKWGAVFTLIHANVIVVYTCVAPSAALPPPGWLNWIAFAPFPVPFRLTSKA